MVENHCSKERLGLHLQWGWPSKTDTFQGALVKLRTQTTADNHRDILPNELVDADTDGNTQKPKDLFLSLGSQDSLHNVAW